MRVRLAVGLVSTVYRRVRPELDPRWLTTLLVLAVGVGAVARGWDGPARLLATGASWRVAAIAAAASVIMNNCPPRYSCPLIP